MGNNIKILILCVILYIHSGKAQSFRPSDPNSFDRPSSLNTGVFGEENHLNETVFPGNQFKNSFFNDTNLPEGQSFGLENKDPNLVNQNFNTNPIIGATLINDSSNNDKQTFKAINNFNDKVDTKAFTLPPEESVKVFNFMDFTSQNDKKTHLAQNFFVSGSSNFSDDLILNNEKEKPQLFSNSNIQTPSSSLPNIPIPNFINNQTTSNLPSSDSMNSAGSLINTFNPIDFKFPFSGDLSSSQNDMLGSNTNLQLTRDNLPISSNNGFPSGDKTFPPTATTFPILAANDNLKSSSNNFPSEISNNHSPSTTILSSENVNSMSSRSNSNITNSDIKTENPFANTNFPIEDIKDGVNIRPLNKMVINDPGTNNKSDIKDLNIQSFNPLFLSTTTITMILEDPVFGNPTPNGWIPQTIPPLSFEKSFQNGKVSESIKSFPTKDSIDSDKTPPNFEGAKTLLNQDITSLDHEKNLMNSKVHFATNESSDINKFLPTENSSVTISDKVISDQTPPTFSKGENIPVTNQDKAIQDSNSHFSGEKLINDQTASPDFHERLPNQNSQSFISDHVISNQNPPRFENDKSLSHMNAVPKQNIPLVESGTSRELYNSSLDSAVIGVKSETNQTLVEIIQNLGLTTFLHYLDLTGLTSTLKNEGTFTIFVPNNKAFDNMPVTVKEDLQSHLDRFKSVLNFHIANGTIVSGDFKNELIFPSLSTGKEIRINLYSINETQILTAAGCSINGTNKFASNGVVHILDKVMFRTPDLNIVGAITSLPKYNQLSSVVSSAKFHQVLAGGPFTFFAPTELAFQKLPSGFLSELLKNETALEDILNYHLISGTYYTEGLLGTTSLTALNNKTVSITNRLGFFKVNSATISETDLTVTNGVIHSIDSLLLPPNYSME